MKDSETPAEAEGANNQGTIQFGGVHFQYSLGIVHTVAPA
jgi:hypothetical protein